MTLSSSNPSDLALCKISYVVGFTLVPSKISPIVLFKNDSKFLPFVVFPDCIDVSSKLSLLTHVSNFKKA